MREGGSIERSRPSSLWLVLLFLLAVSATGFALGTLQLAAVSDRWADWVVPRATLEADRAAVVRQMRAVALLETAEMRVEQRVIGQRGSDSTWSFVGERMVFVARGDVVAGIDLSQMGPADIEVRDATLWVRAPRARILRVGLDEQASGVESRERGWLGIPDRDFETKARREAVELLEQAALNEGLLEKADEQAKIVLSGLLSASSEHPVVVH